MVEITHGGTWFKWSSMDSRDRLWFVVSTVTVIPAAFIIGAAGARWSYHLGHRHAAGRDGPDGFGPLIESGGFRYGALAALLLLLVSLFAWWRFSVRQDELFNRIQNYALGHACAWTLFIAAAWWVLSAGGWVGTLPLEGIVTGGLVLILAFWFYAVRKCT